MGSDPARNLATRMRRDEWVNAIVDELMQFTATYRSLAPGWSSAVECSLPSVHRAWLDPDAPDAAPPDVPDRLGTDFANWINAQLRDPLPVGDPEFLHWRKLALDQFKQEEYEATHER